MALSTKVGVNISALLQGVAGLAPVSASLSVMESFELATGTAANQADKVYSAQATIASGATLSLDMAGSLEDALGAAFTPAKLKLVYIHSLPSNTTDLTVFGDAAHVPILNTVAASTTLKPGGAVLFFQPAAAGYAVTATTADLIKIVNAAGASALVDIVLVGTSA